MRKVGRYRRKKQKKILIIGSLSLLLFLCAGYAAFSTNLSLTARGNIKERKDLYVSVNGSDTEGRGTKEKPYATIQKAYDSAWQNSTIYVMDNITQTNTVTMNKNKDIVLTSENNENNSIIRSASLTTHLIDVQNGLLTLENITIDGNDVPSQESMINLASKVYMEEGTLITKANNINDWGGGFSVNGGTLTMNGGTISECNSNDEGGAAVFVFGDHQEGDNFDGNKQGTFILNNGTIQNNIGHHSIIWCAGIFQMNGGNIINNNTSAGYSIIYIAGPATMKNGNISNNSGVQVTVACDGYLNSYCEMTMSGGLISNNSAEFVGGVRVDGTFTLNGGKIMNNKSNRDGGIYIWNSTATYIYQSGVVCGNTPANQYETSTTCP